MPLGTGLTMTVVGVAVGVKMLVVVPLPTTL